MSDRNLSDVLSLSSRELTLLGQFGVPGWQDFAHWPKIGVFNILRVTTVLPLEKRGDTRYVSRIWPYKKNKITTA